MKRISLIIVDDHQVLIDGLKTIFDTIPDMECLGTASSGKEALALLEQMQPDVVLLDINLPDISGIELCSSIRNQYPSIKIIGLSMYSRGKIIQKMIKKGAHGYLLKNASQNEIQTAIQTVMSGENYFSPHVFETLMKFNLGLDKDKPSFIPELTRREKEILQMISMEHTTQEIANQLYVSVNTVETHRRNLLLKMGARNAVGLIKAAYQKGLLE
jgi:DNA-binding NarL/FixJ family response regulator